ncbi:MAG: hypothetical protein KDA41_22180, partial [Planctomycetales bacterium]|nr:hypothetical protein [Planctomycetales bacterium]
MSHVAWRRCFVIGMLAPWALCGSALWAQPLAPEFAGDAAQGPKGAVDLSPQSLEGPALGSAKESASPAPPAEIDLSPRATTGADPLGGVKAIPDLDAQVTDVDTAMKDWFRDIMDQRSTRIDELEGRLARIERLIEAQSSAIDDLAQRVQPLPTAELRELKEELVNLRNTFQT